MSILKLKSYKPGFLAQREKANRLEYAKGSSFDPDSMDCEIKCWDCKKKFLVSVDYSNLQICVWRCPHCNTPNEVE